MTNGVTIGRAAAFANVTVKTIRHYHRLGLVGEPPRDGSGYRRYGSSELLRLVQVRTLAESGVPLDGIGELLDADPRRFAADLVEIRQRLTERIEELTARRDQLERLTHGDRALLPERACALLARAAEVGLPPEAVAAYREGMVLTRAMAPESLDSLLTGAEHALGDPGFVALNKRCWEARDWSPDDPRLEELATAVADAFLADPELLTIPESLRTRTDTSRYRMLNQHREDESPAMARMGRLVEGRLRAAGVDIPHR
ncbi:MerR family transcriptional regulator [Nocardiopsis metallicus]|uniref:DNA-binding transcriptional MerR regulator n=1 Tax=Nocardiopsis metallicus TaxID=179819 RepID=A0A840WBW6_9ACTN|nr:MerR family transcriptional regulator [Nocardiopsis metallicus]MBB5490521.1 DNA-binding transcriptional MerR regulator [Nocardiopsis metallicus]